ncbi:Elongator subunit IKI1 TDEL_0G00720 [Torulaspora delbrueckii]|uniref:Elongator complex protein 5 n=1 Tax=Torulaspora delbrueckii TaxID=4950 RepID=G8ZYG4_TORDE|nr:hypothetical protein TDEL_0G00720 [Torulaspora delbrueckii]CCE93439.1 hypothetical protein TDEL_0G00720 [Torulaspora delbrueckii]
MSTSLHNPSILLKRVLSLADFSPLVLAIDSIAQSSCKLIEEVYYNAKESGDFTIIYISFETANEPSYADIFIRAEALSLEKLSQTIQSYLPPSNRPTKSKFLVVIDSINHISTNHISQFVGSIASLHSTLLAVYHADLPEYQEKTLAHYPSSIELLNFMATTILKVQQVTSKNATEEEIENDLSRFLIPRGLNNDIFKLTLTTRRKSGRSQSYSFHINTKTHSYETIIASSPADGEGNENPEMLQGLSTFNLSTSAKQKMAKEQVELPFLEAQSFNTGGAIVYQFEKDDDYDEEDPFEDPF